MSQSINQSLFEEEDQIPAHMSFVPFPTNLSSFPSFVGSCNQSLKAFGAINIVTPPPSLSSQAVSVENLVETLLPTTAAHQKPREDHLTFSLVGGEGGGDQVLSLNKSGANSRAWGGGADCLMGKRSSGGDGDDHQYHVGVSAMRMKKMKGGRRKVREPRFCFKTMSDVDVLDDGYKWRKYGQKVVKNTQHPRSYYRCTQDNCRVKKRVERLAEDPRMVITTYEGRHVHSPSNELEDSQTCSDQLANFLW